jgi:hypothetical protein
MVDDQMDSLLFGTSLLKLAILNIITGTRGAGAYQNASQPYDIWLRIPINSVNNIHCM